MSCVCTKGLVLFNPYFGQDPARTVGPNNDPYVSYMYHICVIYVPYMTHMYHYVALKRVFESVLVGAPMSLENDINVALVSLLVYFGS